jgi:hypothetical protein
MIRSALVGLALFALACSTTNIRTEHDPGADFSHLLRYAWAEGEIEGKGNLRTSPEVVDQIIQEIVSDELARRGYRPAGPEAPDFLVQYHAAVNADLKMQSVVRDSGGSTRGPATSVRRGALVLDILEPASQAVIWRASSEVDLDKTAPRAERVDRVRTAVIAMLDKFPPR